jgi:hypothetical protein
VEVSWTSEAGAELGRDGGYCWSRTMNGMDWAGSGETRLDEAEDRKNKTRTRERGLGKYRGKD